MEPDCKQLNQIYFKLLAVEQGTYPRENPDLKLFISKMLLNQRNFEGKYSEQLSDRILKVRLTLSLIYY